MQKFSSKTLEIRKCRRCNTTWSAEDITLSVQDKLEILTITIAHCPVCSDSFASEIDRPTYKRTGKRIK